MSEISITLVPVFIEASSKEELIAKMVATNNMNGKRYNYMPPLKEGNKWVVWYYADVETDKNLEQQPLRNEVE